MKRSPMEMSAWRMAERHAVGIDFRVYLSDYLFGKRSGSGLRKARKEMRRGMRERKVLRKRVARMGQTIYE